MDNTDFLINFLLYIPSILVTLYLAVYTTLYFSFFRTLEKQRSVIRHKVAADWDDKYKTFLTIIDNVHVKYIRVLLRPRIHENKRFRQWQVIYIVFSIFIVLLAVVFKSWKDAPSYCNYILLACVVGFAVLSTAIFIASYHEWKFYKLLDDLDGST